MNSIATALAAPLTTIDSPIQKAVNDCLELSATAIFIVLVVFLFTNWIVK